MKPSGAWPVIDYSRYRMAEAIVERFRAGDSTEDIAWDHNLNIPESGAWVVELIVAAYDRRGMHRPTRGWK